MRRPPDRLGATTRMTETDPAPLPTPTPVLRCDGLHKRYGRTVAVDQVSLDVRPGEIVGLDDIEHVAEAQCLGGVHEVTRVEQPQRRLETDDPRQ